MSTVAQAVHVALSNDHARLSPSNHRWPNCPGSPREESRYPDVAGAAAIDGTGSHLLLELCLKNNCRAEVFDTQIIGTNHPDNPGGWLIGPDRIARVQQCLDYITRRVSELQAQYQDATVQVFSESKSDPGGMFGRTDWWGTVDITITATYGARCVFVETIDFKDGRGWVSEKDNSQLLAYLGGKLRPYIASGPDLVRPFHPTKVNACRMTIVQPKTNPTVRYWEPSPSEVIEKVIELDSAANATDKPDAPLVPDDKGGKGYCRWCKHKPNCTALNSVGIEAVKTMTNLVTTGDKPLFELLEDAVANIETMDATNLADLADTESTVGAIYDKIKTEIERRVKLGQLVPGYEMQPGRGQNVWNENEESIAKKLKNRRLKKDEIYPAKLASPAQVLALESLSDEQKEKIKKDLITYKTGKKKLTKVARELKQEQTAEMLFASVPREETPAPETVSFF